MSSRSSSEDASFWRTLVASIYIMCCAGTVFCFGSFGADIKNSLGLSESEKQLLSLFGDIGLWLNVIGGIVYDRHGMWVSYIGGTAMILVGYLGMWLSLRLELPLCVTVLAWFGMGHGSGWLYVTTVNVNVKNCDPEERGLILGLLSAFFGASATIFISLYNGCLFGHMVHGSCHGGVFGQDVTSYIFSAGIIITTVVAISLTFVKNIRREKPPQANPDIPSGVDMKFIYTYVLGAVVMIYTTSMVTISADFEHVREWSNGLLAVLLLCFLGIPFLPNGLHGEVAEGADTADFLVEALQPLDTGEKYELSGPIVGPIDVPPWMMVRTLRFWVLSIPFGVGVGGCVMVENILKDVVKSRGLCNYEDVGDVATVLATSCDALARLLTGLALTYVPFFPKRALLLCAPIGMAAGNLLLTVDSDAVLYVSPVVIGASNGLLWSLVPWYTAKEFGLSHFGANLGFMVVSSALFSLIFSVVLEPAVYQHFSGMHQPPSCFGDDETDGGCFGLDCFNFTFYIVGLFGVSACAVASTLHNFSRRSTTHIQVSLNPSEE